MKKQIILLTICGLVIFVLGAGLGIFYQMRQSPPQATQQSQIQNTVLLKTLSSELSSKVIPLYAEGSVTNIESTNIVLDFEGSKLLIPISKTAKINLFMPAVGSKRAYYQSAQFSDIKVGDRLNITLNLSPDYKLEGQLVNILVSAPAPGKKTIGS